MKMAILSRYGFFPPFGDNFIILKLKSAVIAEARREWREGTGRNARYGESPPHFAKDGSLRVPGGMNKNGRT
ncbi:MAG: hypothetical protein WC593_10470 [Methanoregula sp.]